METQNQRRKPIPLGPRTKIAADSIVADILNDWPETVPVFLRRHLGCVGCDMSPFDTVADVARIYKFDAAAFLEELQTAVQSGNLSMDSTV
jgi:hybrid cluster-associated redox disulfide protein